MKEFMTFLYLLISNNLTGIKAIGIKGNNILLKTEKYNLKLSISDVK